MGREIPLYRRDGTLCGVALVDEEDFGALNLFRWRFSRGGYERGLRHNGYAVRSSGGTVFSMHREIMRPPTGMEIDHINGDGLDNRRVNLRVTSRAENAQNRQPNANGSSCHRGVYWDRRARKWCAEVRAQGQRAFRAWFADENLAAIAASEARRRFLTHAVESRIT